MPTYEYRCEKCGRKFEAEMSIVAHERKPKAACPKCKSRKVEQLPTAFQAVTAKKT